MTILDYFAAFLDNFFRVFITFLSANGRNSIFAFLTSAIITCLFMRVIFKRGK